MGRDGALGEPSPRCAGMFIDSVFLSQPQVLWIHELRVTVMSRRHRFPRLLASEIFPHLHPRRFLSLGEGVCMYVPFVDKHSPDTYSLNFDKLWISALTTTYYIKKLPYEVWELCTNSWVQRYEFRDHLKLCPFRKMIVVKSPLGPLNTPGSSITRFLARCPVPSLPFFLWSKSERDWWLSCHLCHPCTHGHIRYSQSLLQLTGFRVVEDSSHQQSQLGLLNWGNVKVKEVSDERN